MSQRIPRSVLFLPLNTPTILRIEKNGSTTGQVVCRFVFTGLVLFTQLAYFLHKRGIFFPARRHCYAVRSYNAIMILLCTIQRLTVTIRTNEIASTGKNTPKPKTHSTRERLRINTSPIHLTGLKFHHPISTLYGTEEIVGPGNTQRVTHPIPPSTDTFIVAINHITGIALKIKSRTAADMAFVIVWYVIRGDPLVTCILLDQQALLVQKVVGLFGCKTTVIQYLMMIHKHLYTLRQRDFVERRINFTPESRPPGVVQFVYVVIVFLAQEITKSQFGLRIVIELYSWFIVQLPTDDTRIISIVACQLFDHAVSQFTIQR